MANVIDILYERGFVDKTTHEKELNDFIQEGNITCYIGFDPTASSLHVGSLVPIMSLAHMQRQGHRPIALVGGGTGLVGDPSGKAELRNLLTLEEVEENAIGIKNQLSRFIDFNDGRALLLNNAEWLTKLEYISLLRDIGRHFSVNRMIKAESYKMRLEAEDGLNFIEFNYMILQAYDFLELYNEYGCTLQMGGSDQWGNIVAGIELIRKVKRKTAFGLTFPLITTSGGAKMGKTAKGAVWLDPVRTTPYEYYQYWINTDDRDVERFLALFTFLPMDEIQAVGTLSDADLNNAKSVLAFEAALLAHGREEAIKSYHAARNMFGARNVPTDLLPSSTIPRGEEPLTVDAIDSVEESEDTDTSVPHSYIDESVLRGGLPAFKAFHMVGLANSGSAARRLVEQGGAYINGNRVKFFDYLITSSDVKDMEILLRAGKKRFHKILLKN